jgi:hypothetical protein
LRIGDEQAGRFQAEVTRIEAALIGTWGQRNGYTEEVAVPLQSYTVLASLIAAVDDWKIRIRPVLAARAKTATSALADFERKNSL